MFKYYWGPERRQQQRRHILDRRDLLRWQPESQTRRSQVSRRHLDSAKTLWDQ